MNARIAFQGGGAKLGLLLAAAEALQDVERRHRIKFTRLSGTSAGAIVATLLAAKRKIGDARAALLEQKEKFLNGFRVPAFPVALWRISKGRPFWSSELLKSWLTEQLAPFCEEHNISSLNFDHFPENMRPELSVVWTNLSTGHADVVSGENNVVEAVLSSAGIPFCFRTWKSNNQEVIVDGGLCKNLPIGPLVQGSPSDDEILAFTFDRPLPGRLLGAKDFSLSLLDAAITDSVETAQSIVPKDALFVLNASKEGVSTFDFPSALAFLSSNRYGALVDDLIKRIDNLVTRRGLQIRNIRSDLWKHPEVSKMMRSLGNFYQESFLQHRFRYALMRIQVTAHSLVTEGNPGFHKNDEIKYTFEFEATEQPIKVIRLYLSAPLTVDHIPDYEVEVSLKSGKRVDVEFVGACVKDKPHLRALLALFSPPLKKEDGLCRLTLSDYAPDALGGLIRLDKDFTDAVRLEVSRAEGTIGAIEAGIFTPSDLRSVRLKSHNMKTTKEMTAFDKAVSFGHPPQGFTSFGWKAEDVDVLQNVQLEFASDGK